jgi:thimet oligopeptidase
MVANPQTVDKFLRDVKSAVREVERREIAELTALKAANLHKPVGEVTLQRWDADYYQEHQRKARFSVDQEAMRKYFPTEASIGWVMAISSRLYGIRFAPATVPTWHPDVRYFDVFDAATGKLKGGIYIDPFPRDASTAMRRRGLCATPRSARAAPRSSRWWRTSIGSDSPAKSSRPWCTSSVT